MGVVEVGARDSKPLRRVVGRVGVRPPLLSRLFGFSFGLWTIYACLDGMWYTIFYILDTLPTLHWGRVGATFFFLVTDQSSVLLNHSTRWSRIGHNSLAATPPTDTK